MPLAGKLSRPLKAARADEDEESFSDNLEGLSHSASDSGEGGVLGSELDSTAEQSEPKSDGDDDDDDEPSFRNKLSQVTFDALSKAHDALSTSSRKRKRGSTTTAEAESKLRILRARLAELKAAKKAAPRTTGSKPGGSSGSSGSHIHPSRSFVGEDSEGERGGGEEEEASNSDSDSDSDAPPETTGSLSRLPGRSSKHAPAVQTSTRQVTRRRVVMEAAVPRGQARDPRFDPLVMSRSGPKHLDTTEGRYSFLKDYRRSEIEELRGAVEAKKGKRKAKSKMNVKGVSEEDREVLKKKLKTMEEREKRAADEERTREVRRKWKKEEMEKVKDGKRPFYLKKAAEKELQLTTKFKSMTGTQRVRAMERRHKKLAHRERRAMPADRRR